MWPVKAVLCLLGIFLMLLQSISGINQRHRENSVRLEPLMFLRVNPARMMFASMMLMLMTGATGFPAAIGGNLLPLPLLLWGTAAPLFRFRRDESTLKWLPFA